MATFENLFGAFAKFGDTKADGRTITLTQSDKWMKQAKVLDKRITTTDTGIAFNKFKQKNLDFNDYNKFIETLASSKGIDPNEIREKMIKSGGPGLSNVTQTAGNEALTRLTDTSQYTGSHKERFDESGKGKGKAGRSDNADTSGYVQGYKQNDTYDKSHP